MTDTAKNILIVLITIVVVGLGTWFYFKGSTNTPTPSPAINTTQQTDSSSTSATTDTSTSSPNTINIGVNTAVDAGAAKEFTITGQNFRFTPNLITVKKGDSVKINFVSNGGSHNLVIDAFHAKTDIVGSGKSASVTFTADKAGTFEYYCSVGNHRAMGMVGTIVVK